MVAPAYTRFEQKDERPRWGLWHLLLETEFLDKGRISSLVILL